MMYRIFLFFLLLSCLPGWAQQASEYTKLSNQHATGQTAYEVTAFTEQFWRLAGNPGFDSSIYHVVSKLEAAGFRPEGNAAGPLTYRIERRPLEHPAWQPENAEVRLGESGEVLLSYMSNRNMISVNSHSTPPEGITAQVVWLKDLEDLPGADVKGKIVYGEIHPYYLYKAAVEEFGALGIITYGMPSYLNPESNTKSIQFNSIPYSASSEAWSVALSYEANERLKQYLEGGENELNITINTRFVLADELTIVAKVIGTKYPDEEVVISAHVQEPGANDNASGVGAATEIAEILAEVNKSGECRPLRTITLLWGDEIISTRRYVDEFGKRIKWGFSLDMVGENTEVTGGTFLIEKMPDPSAIWTRGADKHTEWGGSKMSKEQLKPHYLNDFVIQRFSDQGKAANWEVSTNPFEGGSDHVPFLRGDIPAVLFWHFTDQFYHTDQDRIDKVSRETLKNVVAGTLATVMALASGEETLAFDILEEIREAAESRLMTETKLSAEAISRGEDRREQLEIIDTWVQYYKDTAATVSDLSASAPLDAKIKEIQQQIDEMGTAARASL